MLLLEGEVKPVQTAGLQYYIAYTVVMEEFRDPRYPEVTVTLYPRVVCQDPWGCRGVYAPPASVLEVTYWTHDPVCNTRTYEAYGRWSDPVQSLVLNDNLGYSCRTPVPPAELILDMTHYTGAREYLEGYRTY